MNRKKLPKAKSIWIFAEEVSPGHMRWGIRYGGKWYDVAKIYCWLPLQTKFQKIAPHMYLQGHGFIVFRNDTAHIRLHP